MPNPEITNNDIQSLVLRNGEFEDITLEIVDGAETFPLGTVIAFNASTGKWQETKSGTAAVANAKAVLAQEVVATGNGDIDNVRSIIGGTLDQTLLTFNGADTVNTIPPSGADTFKIQLRSYDIFLIAPAQQTFDDNQ